jgi:hypothetical protein
MVQKLPAEHRSHWAEMFRQATSGAAGGMAVEAVKAALKIALAGFGIAWP